MFTYHLTLNTMLKIVSTILLAVSHFSNGQQTFQGGRSSATTGIKCPEISCELHHYPEEHCKVHTFFVYHGITCDGCIEDICHGSQAVADSLIGKDPATDHSVGGSPISTDNLGIHNDWDRLSGVNRMQPNVQNIRTVGNMQYIIDPANFITRNAAMYGLQRKRVSNPRDTLENKITCPQIECHLHHQPEAHCMVESYFLYQGKRCTGCIEDICLGAQIVSDLLIGKNETIDPHSGSFQNGRVTNGDVPMIRDRTNIGRQNSFPLPTRQTSGTNQQIQRLRNPFFSRRNQNTQWINRENNRGLTGNFAEESLINQGSSTQISRNSKSWSSNPSQSSFSNRGQGDTRLQTGNGSSNPDQVVVVDQNPIPSVAKRGKGIDRFTGGARSYLQSLFIPAFNQ